MSFLPVRSHSIPEAGETMHASPFSQVTMFAILLLASSASHATTIRILEDNFTRQDTALNNFYRTQPGFDSDLFTGSVDEQSLADVDLLGIVNPEDAFSAAEISAMTSYVANGGRILFIGEVGIPNFAPRNAFMEDVLGAFGSTIRFADDELDGGQAMGSVADGQIEGHPLSSGMDRAFVYAGISSLAGVDAADLLLETEDSPGSFFAVYETVGSGDIVVIGDSSWTGFTMNPNFSNGTFARNIATTDVPTVVTEPAALNLLIVAAASFASSRRRRPEGR